VTAHDGSGLRARVDRVCRREADDRRLRLQILDEIRRVVRFDWYAWVLTDPATEVGVSPVADTPSLADLPRVVRAKYVTELNRWTGLGGSFVSLMAATQGEVTRSLMWREVLSEYGVGDVASGVFRDPYGCWAFLDLWRTDNSGPFTPEELECLSVALNVATEALRRIQAGGFTAMELGSTLDGPVVMLLSPHLEVLAETEATVDYLRALLPTPQDRAPIPACAYNVAAQLVARERGVDAHPALARLHAGGGHDAAGRPHRRVWCSRGAEHRRGDLDGIRRGAGRAVRPYPRLVVPRGRTARAPHSRPGHQRDLRRHAPLRAHRPRPPQVDLRQDWRAQSP
jgi:hypothetical protein